MWSLAKEMNSFSKHIVLVQLRRCTSSAKEWGDGGVGPFSTRLSRERAFRDENRREEKKPRKSFLIRINRIEK